MLEFTETLPVAGALPQGRGLAVTPVVGLGIAALSPHRGRETEVAWAVHQTLGLRLEDRSVRSTAGGLTALGIGPSKWLVTAEGAGNRLTLRLKQIVGDDASVEDQSDGYTVLRLVGSGCHPLLARGVNIDLHPTLFVVGAVAVTSIARVGVMLWRTEDEADAPAFELAVFRSMAGSLLHWLDASITGAGLRPS